MFKITDKIKNEEEKISKLEKELDDLRENLQKTELTERKEQLKGINAKLKRIGLNVEVENYRYESVRPFRYVLLNENKEELLDTECFYYSDDFEKVLNFLVSLEDYKPTNFTPALRIREIVFQLGGRNVALKIDGGGAFEEKEFETNEEFFEYIKASSKHKGLLETLTDDFANYQGEPSQLSRLKANLKRAKEQTRKFEDELAKYEYEFVEDTLNPMLSTFNMRASLLSDDKEYVVSIRNENTFDVIKMHSCNYLVPEIVKLKANLDNLAGFSKLIKKSKLLNEKDLDILKDAEQQLCFRIHFTNFSVALESLTAKLHGSTEVNFETVEDLVESLKENLKK